MIEWNIMCYYCGVDAIWRNREDHSLVEDVLLDTTLISQDLLVDELDIEQIRGIQNVAAATKLHYHHACAL